MNRRDYVQQMIDDLPTQYRDKEGIEIFQKAMARQLEEVFEFFYDLHTRRSLHVAEGKQLDGIGDIVVLSRGQALAIAEGTELAPMYDDMYRMYLLWKIALNTSECTHSNVYSLLKMMWEDTPLFYSEKPEYPATAIYTIPRPMYDFEEPLFRVSTMVKAAGVTLVFNFEHRGLTGTDYSGAVVFDVIREHFTEGV